MFQYKKSYFNALYTQLEATLKNREIETVFIGGGTPSSVEADFYEPIFAMFSKEIVEISIEANPNSASPKWQEKIAKLGANRISFGVQSFDEKKLRYLSRAHSKQDALDAIRTAKENFANVSMDLMYNVPNDDYALIEKDLDIFLGLNIDHISCYELTLEQGTPFASLKLNEDKFTMFIQEKLQKNGLMQYEVSNYGEPCKHNVGYWQYKEYLGVGAGAIGFENGVRYSNEKSIKTYIQNPFANTKEVLTSDDIHTEKLFLGLRSNVGFTPQSDAVKTKAEMLANAGKLIKKSNRYYNKNFFLADEIALYLLK
jgi:oxygen-independent coproporphyrinogen-3 oxidase